MIYTLGSSIHFRFFSGTPYEANQEIMTITSMCKNYLIKSFYYSVQSLWLFPSKCLEDNI